MPIDHTVCGVGFCGGFVFEGGKKLMAEQVEATLGDEFGTVRLVLRRQRSFAMKAEIWSMFNSIILAKGRNLLEKESLKNLWKGCISNRWSRIETWHNFLGLGALIQPPSFGACPNFEASTSPHGFSPSYSLKKHRKI